MKKRKPRKKNVVQNGRKGTSCTGQRQRNVMCRMSEEVCAEQRKKPRAVQNGGVKKNKYHKFGRKH